MNAYVYAGRMSTVRNDGYSEWNKQHFAQHIIIIRLQHSVIGSYSGLIDIR